MLTRNGLSPSVSTAELWISVIVFAVLYGALGTIDLILMTRYSRKELAPAPDDSNEPIPAMQY
jgi:cytochrome bd-type quinol oxidase subunit 1